MRKGTKSDAKMARSPVIHSPTRASYLRGWDDGYVVVVGSVVVGGGGVVGGGVVAGGVVGGGVVGGGGVVAGGVVGGGVVGGGVGVPDADRLGGAVCGVEAGADEADGNTATG
jgi:hypothetical protein